MNFSTNVFSKKEESIKTYHDFWKWFEQHEKSFFEAVKNSENLEHAFFDQLSTKLNAMKDGCYFLTGMYNATTAELILTPDGTIKNISFVEDLVANAPQLPRWKFTSLKPATDIQNVSIQMDGYSFHKNNLSFYADENLHYPDEVELKIVYHDYDEKDNADIVNGVYIFLDSYLGEEVAVTSIDNLEVIPKEEAEAELIPIDKLKAYLIWREKEFVEKHEGIRHDSSQDSYANFNAELRNGKPIIGIINTTLLEWESKTSHPWILQIDIMFDGHDNNGMPKKDIQLLMNDFEEEIMLELKDIDGYLNVGRQTGNGKRTIYFACHEFRKPSRVLDEFKKLYAKRLSVSHDIYKDKYWQSFEKFS